MKRKLTAEAIGTFVLVFGGCGSAVFAAAFPAVGIGLLGVSLAFGLTVVCGAYAFGAISGWHFNPAVSVGLAVAGRFDWRDLPKYVGAQLLGGVVAAGLLLLLLKGRTEGYDAAVGGLAPTATASIRPGATTSPRRSPPRSCSRSSS